MAFDGNGTFLRLYSWVDDRDNAINIDATRMDAEMDGMALALSQCYVRDGQAAMTGNVPMGGNRVTGLGSGALATPSVAFTASANSGVYWNGTGIGLVNAGTERLTVSTTGVAVTGTLSASGTATIPTINNATGVSILYNGTARVTTTSTGVTTTGKLLTAASATGSAGFNLPHGAAPTTPANGDIWTTTSGLYARINGATTGPFIGLGANTFTGKQTFVASATGAASINVPHGTAPTSPANGDIWTTTGGLYARVNGVTAGPFIDNTTNTFTGKQTTAASTTGTAGFNIPHGTAPTTPTNGDIWTTTAGLYARINGATVGPYAIASTLVFEESADSIRIGTGTGGTGAGMLYNTIFGRGSGAGGPGSSISTGDGNTLMGYSTGRDLNSGADNAFYGRNTGYQITTGGLNTLIGSYAGANIANASSNNTIVGPYQGSASMSNMVALADGAGTRKFWHDNTDAYVVHSTTASAANAFLDSATNALKRSTSSLKYKRDVEKMQLRYAKELLRLEPIFYKSAVPTDNQEWSHYGFAAEELAEIEPRFVQYTVHPDDYTDPDENNERFPIENPRLVPDGVAYDRMVVPLLMLVQDLHKRVKALEGGAA